MEDASIQTWMMCPDPLRQPVPYIRAMVGKECLLEKQVHGPYAWEDVYKDFATDLVKLLAKAYKDLEFYEYKGTSFDE